eukprot:scaffold1234_cov190-Alexandrium_tamarense.AAC.15
MRTSPKSLLPPPKTTLTDGSTSAKNKRQGRESTTCKVPPSSPRNEHKDDDRKDQNEPSAHHVLGTKEGFCPLINGGVDLIETTGGGLVVGSANEAGGVRDAFGADGDAGD